MIKLTRHQFLDLMILVRGAMLHNSREQDVFNYCKDAKTDDAFEKLLFHIKDTNDSLDAAYDILKEVFESYWPNIVDDQPVCWNRNTEWI